MYISLFFCIFAAVNYNLNNMARLIVDNLGPIKHVEVVFKKVSVLIGPQSSGKSTIAKVYSFCCWLDKMTDGTHKALHQGAFKKLQSYHRMNTYFESDTRIYFEGENIIYAYNYPKDGDATVLPFSKDLNVDKYYQPYPCGEQKEICLERVNREKSPKVEYIPAERNFVASVPNLNSYLEADDSLQDFVNTWYKTKKHYSKDNEFDILNLGMQYFYNESDASDYVRLDNRKDIPVSCASSGVQSLVPLLGMIKWFTSDIYRNQAERPFSPEENEQISKLLRENQNGVYGNELTQMIERLVGFAKGKIYTHTQLILEEPEQNLFPNTQCDLIDFILASINHGKDHRMLMTTHSPYVLSYLNVLLRRTNDDAIFVSKENISVYRLYNGECVDLIGQDKQGRAIVDTYGLSETMESIYSEFVERSK